MRSILPRLLIRVVCSVALLPMLAQCDRDDRICMPADPAQGPAALATEPQPSRQQPPERFVLIIDESLGMFGFRNQPVRDERQFRDTEFTQMMGRLKDLNVPFEDDSYVLPGSNVANDSDKAPRKITHLQDEIKSSFCSVLSTTKCNYLNYAYISSFIERARADKLGIPHAHLNGSSNDLVLLVTDLQPDIPPGGASSITFLNDTFEPLIAKDHLAIGMVPVVSRFIGPLYDTRVINEGPNRLDPPKLASDDRQPFFLIPIGQEKDVKWMLDHLKNIRDATVPDSRSLDYVMFSGNVPAIPADPFEFQTSQTDEIQRTPMPPHDEQFAAVTQVFLALHRRTNGGDITFEYHPKPVSDVNSVLPYRVHVTDPQPRPKVWVYLGGPTSPAACRERWSLAREPAAFRVTLQQDDGESPREGNNTKPDGDSILITLGNTEKQGLLAHAVYYFEDIVNIVPMPASPKAPQWVRDWSVEPDKTVLQERLRGRDTRAGHVSVGVNSLSRLFDGMPIPRTDTTRRVQLRFAMSVEGN